MILGTSDIYETYEQISQKKITSLDVVKVNFDFPFLSEIYDTYRIRGNIIIFVDNQAAHIIIFQIPTRKTMQERGPLARATV